MTHCKNLVAVHRGHGGSDKGRRAEEVSINRAIVVLTVAAWQAVVQDLATAAIEAGSPVAGSPILPQTYNVIAGRGKQEIHSFNTPNAENSRRLLQGVGFDPWNLWTWKQMGGQGKGSITVEPHQVLSKMNDWLKLRHEIAHGESNLTKVVVLQSVRDYPNPPEGWTPQIRLRDAESCMVFFRRVSELTGNGLAAHLGQPTGQWTS